LLARHRQTHEFICDQYHHGKTILSLGASTYLLERAGVSAVLPTVEIDPGILLSDVGDAHLAAERFMAAIAQQRHTARLVSHDIN